MNGEPSALSAPRDHTGDALLAAYKSAEHLRLFARDNVRDAERGLELARLAEQRAAENAREASEALRQHNPSLHDAARWLVTGEPAAA